MKSSLFLTLTLLAVVSTRALAAENHVNINVNVSVTAEGKKIARPFRESPVYYYPVLAGYTEAGQSIGGIKPPSNKEVVRLLAKALASQGYLVFSSEKTPTLQLVFTWGHMNARNGSVAAKNQMLKLVSGETLPSTDDDPVGTWIRTPEHQRTLAESDDDRYFVMISAYDHEASVNRKKEILLWEARMSVPMNEVSSFTEVLPTLLHTAAQHFGRVTLPPYRVRVPLVASLDDSPKTSASTAGGE